MSQHDLDLANSTGRTVRLDINYALAALASNSSGATEPAVSLPFQFWMDTTLDILKIRNEADDAWIDFAHIDGTGFFNLSASGTALLQVNPTLGAIVLLGTKGVYVPQGTTAERPSGTPTAVLRYNTTTLQFEGYANGGWFGLGGFTGYAAIAGSASYCTHATLAAALADSAVVAGSKILVTESQTIDTTISVAKANISIDFLPGVTFTNGTAGTGMTIDAGGCRIKGGRFSGFTTAITITASFQFNFITECRFVSCTTEVNEADSAPVNVVTNNLTE